MSKDPLLGDRKGSRRLSLSEIQAAETRLPFSRWRCLWDPYTAIDKDVCEPFARLSIILDKAVGLKSADWNGLADPYVTITLNGDEEKPLKSETKKGTLAPVWNEGFIVDIFHPVSIVTVTVWDEEYGDGDFADFLGLDDVLAGWVDLRIGAMPMNEWMSGWFDLGDPDHFKDTITGRMEEPPPEGHRSAGRIHLKMILGTTHPHDELFAMCLPLPETGHACHLDLADLVHDVVSLSKAMDKIQNDIWGDIEYCLHHATPIFCVCMMMIWMPSTAIPVLVILTPLALIYLSEEFSDNAKEVPHGLGGGVRKDKLENKAAKEEASKDEVEDENREVKDDWKTKSMNRDSSTKCLAVPAVNRQSSTASLTNKTMAKSSSTTSLKSNKSANSSGGGGVRALTDAEKKALEAKKQAEQTEATLKGLVHLLPKHAAKELRKTAADMESLVQFVEVVENLAALREGYGTTFLINIAVGGAVPIALLLWYCADYQKLILQLTFTVVVCVNLWQYSFPGRMATGFYYFFLAHWRIRAKFRHDFDDDHETVEMRALAKVHVRHLGLTAKGKMHEDHIDLHGHAYDLKTFENATWCMDCGHMLWGLKEQGFQCKKCDHIVCHDCAHSDGDGTECPGQCKEHDFHVDTFHHPTWCSNCKEFLWGTKNQGSSCTVCNKIVCNSCAKKMTKEKETA